MHPDLERVIPILTFLGANTAIIVAGTIDGQPTPKKRVRFSKSGHAYSAQDMKDAEEATGWRLRQMFPNPLEGNLAVVCIFCRSTRARVDVDNLMKHLLDSANKIAWHDDYQITALCGLVEYDPQNPRTILAVGQHFSSTMDRSATTDSRKGGKGTEATCTKCGEKFIRESHNTNRCPECRYKLVRSGRPGCSDCGKPVSYTAERCYDCYQKARKRGDAGPHLTPGVSATREITVENLV